MRQRLGAAALAEPIGRASEAASGMTRARAPAGAGNPTLSTSPRSRRPDARTGHPGSPRPLHPRSRLGAPDRDAPAGRRRAGGGSGRPRFEQNLLQQTDTSLNADRPYVASDWFDIAEGLEWPVPPRQRRPASWDMARTGDRLQLRPERLQRHAARERSHQGRRQHRRVRRRRGPQDRDGLEPRHLRPHRGLLRELHVPRG